MKLMWAVPWQRWERTPTCQQEPRVQLTQHQRWSINCTFVSFTLKDVFSYRTYINRYIFFQVEQNTCNHVKKSDKSPSGSGGAEFKTETVQTVETVDTGGGRGHYQEQDNLAFRSPEYETEQELSWPDRTESFEHERTSGSWSDSYDEGSRGSSAQDQGYRIPYRLMRDPGDRERVTPPQMSPPPQPTHRAPGMRWV